MPNVTRTAYVESISFKGPLPPPTLFQEYDKTLPGAAERIMLLAEREQAHRQGWEMSVLDAQRSDSRRGQWLGFAIAAMSITAAIVCALYGKPIVAIASLAAVVAGILSSVFTRNPSKSE